MFKAGVIFCGALMCSLFIMQGAAAETGADHQAVSAAVEKLRVAMTSPIDQAALEQLTDDSLSYGHSSGVVQNKSQFIAQLASGESTFVSIALSDQTINVQQDVAIVRHVLTAKTNDSGKPGNVAIKILLVWKKSGDQWRLLARQAVRFAAPT